MSYEEKWDIQINLDEQMDFVVVDRSEETKGQKPLVRANEPSQEETYDTDYSEIYFRDMARFPLLNQKQEVEIARRIEINQGKLAQVMLRYPGVILEVINGDKQRELSRLHKIMDDTAALQQQLRILGDRDHLDLKMVRKEEQILQQKHEVFRELSLNDSQIENIISKLTSYEEQIDLAAKTIQSCIEKVDLCSEEAQKLTSSAKKNLRQVERALRENGISVKESPTLKVTMESALEEIRRVESAIRTGRGQLKQDVKELLRAHTRAKAAKEELLKANLRLVIHMARKYTGLGVHFLDLVQEGNMGLMKAVDKFDYHRGHRFSTYATWWIRQAMTRAIQQQSRTIRIPVHMLDTISKVRRTSQELFEDLGRRPKPDEIAKKMELPVEKVKKVIEVAKRRYQISLETPIGNGKSQLGNFIADKDAASPEEVSIQKEMAERTRRVLATLTPREEKILRRRFGIGEARQHTLQEVGEEFGVTRERVRQIEEKALKKLRHPRRRKSLGYQKDN